MVELVDVYSDEWCTMCTGCVAEDCKGRHPFLTFNGEIGPHLELYELFHSVRLREERHKAAAEKIQRRWRDFVAKRKLRKIKRMLQEQLGAAYNWSDFVASYKDLVQRVQRRHGADQNLTKFHFNLDDVLHFLNNQNRLDRLFSELATADGKLWTQKLPEFFHKAGMYPTKREIDAAFKLTCKGCAGTGELMFVMESAENSDTFKKQKKLICDLLGRLDCVSANSVRVGCINTEGQWFGLSTFQEKNDVISAIGELKCTGTGSTGNLEKSLETMRHVMTSESRKDVTNRMAIILRSQPTDPKTDNSPTKRRASVTDNPDTRRPSITINPISCKPLIAVNPAKRTPSNAVNPASRRPSIVVNPVSRRSSIVVNPASHKSSIDVNSNKHKPFVAVDTDGMLSPGKVNSNSRRRLSVPGATSIRRSLVITGMGQFNKETGSTGGDDYDPDVTVIDDLSCSKASPDTDRLIHQCQLAKDEDIRLVVIDAKDRNAGRDAINAVLASDVSLVFPASDHRIVTKIRNEIMDIVCADADCTHCRFHGSKTRSSRTIQNQGHLLKQELMEMLWTLYPPREAKVEALRRSTWARPVVDEFEIDPHNSATVRSESDSNGEKRTSSGLRNQVLTTDLERCLRLVFQARLRREGVLHLPIGKNGVEHVTDVDRAIQLTNLYITGNKNEPTNVM